MSYRLLKRTFTRFPTKRVKSINPCSQRLLYTYNNSNRHQRYKNRRYNYHKLKMAATLAPLTLGGLFMSNKSKKKEENKNDSKFPVEYDKNGNRVYSLAEIKTHTEVDKGIWVTYKGNVYDITTFMEAHPGGPNRILMVAGNDLSEYWKIYNLHERKHIQQLFNEYKIGVMRHYEIDKQLEESKFYDGYINDPKRPHVTVTNKDNYLVASQHPWNAEPKLDLLYDSGFYTPNEVFWVRNHNAVPLIDDINDWSLDVDGIGVKNGPVTLTYNDLKTKFKKYEIDVTLQCAGNRQQDYVICPKEGKPLYVAPHWYNGAIGNAKWGGVLVRDVLKYCGVDVDGMALDNYNDETSSIEWVNFLGLDSDETGVEYAGTIPIDKIIDPKGDCLLAFEMNGKILPRDHGYPLRLVAPGHAGCRQVKWLQGITLSKKVSDLDSGSKLDRHHPPNICFAQIKDGEEGVDMSHAPVIQTMPVQSIICKYDIDYNKYCINIYGVAWAGGGKGIARVDISIDGGHSFTGANLDRGDHKVSYARNWAWVRFNKCIKFNDSIVKKLKQGQKVNIELVSKGVDTDFNSQPENMKAYWNVLGICVNHWKRIPLTLDYNKYNVTLSNPNN